MEFPAIKVGLPALALLTLLPASFLHPAFGDNNGLMEIALEAMERLTPDLTDPPVTFSIRNWDMQTGDKVEAWQIQIFDQSGQKVSFIQGRNRPSDAVIPWAGVSGSGKPLPDGFYYASFAWLDSGKQLHATLKISITLFTPLEIRGLSSRKLKFGYTKEGLVVSIAESMIFRPGRAKIQDEALPAMREIFLLLKSCPANKAAVRGYTDSTGSLRKNLRLSRERAACVYRYLVSAGINPDRLTYNGLGPAVPVASNATEAGRVRNRRVEVVVLKTNI